ncbi:DoxX family membrane protein [Vibrio sp. CAIM 722]|uniref:DoxX family membrane protein n=1 Tax=Vibrio eleionomae TaxID=2653505 RepID=A0A7X4LKB3_9VIBR|nr:DoxX family protein [Vibrio eleionomae]MZI93151.1 DoxX family membrane protein [Vibrio eleionomae]
MKAFLKKLMTSDAGFAPLALRIPVGIIYMAHGSQKLFGWFGGHGLSGTAQWMNSIGLEPGIVMATLAGSGEFFGGLLLLLGLHTRPAAFVTAFTMIVAIFSVHISHGLFLSNGGFEYGLALFAASLSILFSGQGKVAVDNLIVRQTK